MSPVLQLGRPCSGDVGRCGRSVPGWVLFPTLITMILKSKMHPDICLWAASGAGPPFVYSAEVQCRRSALLT